MQTFKAFRVIENLDKTFFRQIIEQTFDDLPKGEVLIKVKYSSLNYKDALSATGNKGVSRNFPHTPGIDAAGIVEESQSSAFVKGEEVLITGFDLGMNTAGGFAEYIRVPAHWVVKLPIALTLKESMILGTAGLTAGLCIDKLLKNGLSPEKGKVIVTGSTGGVGTIAVMILAKLGFEVVAVTGKPEGKDFLLKLGAKEIISREEIDDQSGKPLLKGIYAGAIDTVGGNILATILKSSKNDGVVAACGLVKAAELNTSVFPFILRGVSLFGIDSAECAISWRKEIWQYLANNWKPENLENITKTISLNELEEAVTTILAGKQLGRILVVCE